MDETKRTIARENEDVSIIGDINNNNNNNNEKDGLPQHSISLTTGIPFIHFIIHSLLMTINEGITPPPLDQVSKRQRRIRFYVDLHYASLFKAFISHFEDEILGIGDPLLEPFIHNNNDNNINDDNNN